MRLDITRGGILPIVKGLISYGFITDTEKNILREVNKINCGSYIIIKLPVPYIKRTHNPFAFGTAEYICYKLIRIHHTYRYGLQIDFVDSIFEISQEPFNERMTEERLEW